MPDTVVSTNHDFGPPATGPGKPGGLSTQGAKPDCNPPSSPCSGGPSFAPPSGCGERQTTAEGDPMERGYFKVWRKQEDSDFWSMRGTVYRAVWLTILQKANWKRGCFNGHEVLPGEFVCGVENFGRELGLSRQSIRTVLRRFIDWKMVSLQNLTNKATKIIICNWATYNGLQPSNQPATNQQLTNGQPTTNQRLTTIKELKNGRIEELNTPALREKQGPAIAFAHNYPQIPKTLDTPNFREAWERWQSDLGERGIRATSGMLSGQLATLEAMGPVQAIKAIENGIEKGLRAPGLPFEKKPQPSKLAPGQVHHEKTPCPITGEFKL